MRALSRFKPYLWVVAAAFLALLAIPLTAPVEDVLFDARMSLRRDAGWPDDVVLVPIDDATITGVNKTWPWSRDLQAKLLKGLDELGAKTIFYDVFLPVESENAANDAALAAALSRTVLGVGAPPGKMKGPDATPPMTLVSAMAPAIAGGTWWDQGVAELVVPREQFVASAAGVGHSLSEPRKHVRFHLPAITVTELPADRVLPSSPLVAFLKQRGFQPSDAVFGPGYVKLPTGRTISLDRGAFRLDFVPRSDDSAHVVRALDVLRAKPEDDSLRAKLEGKLACVYLDNVYQTTDQPATVMGARTAGGYVMATALKTFEHGASPKEASTAGTTMLLFALGMAAVPWLSRRPPNTILRTGVVASVAVVVLASLTVPVFDLFPPIASPLVFIAIATGTLTASSVRTIDQERTQLRELLRQSGVDVRATQGSVVVTMGPGVQTDGGTPRAADGKTAVKKGPPKPLDTLDDGATREVRKELRADESELLLSGDPLEHPVQLGRYEVQRSIGRGGMGAIFLAIDKDLARPVALKILSTADPSAFRRFRQEAMAVARLVHPNVVQIHEVGFDAQVPYLVMEYVPGGTVSDLIRDPEVPLPLPWIRGTKIIHCIAKGLGAAHQHGIVHRDIKPSNLLLVKRTGDEAKIADFGIAKLSGGENLTREGSFVGTVGYLSPEQAKGKNVDARSDVYSLGLTWYKLLSGQSAFEGTTAEVLQQTVHRDTAPDPREINPEIPLAVVELMQRMTALDPSGRPRDCNAVAAGIAAILGS